MDISTPQSAMTNESKPELSMKPEVASNSPRGSISSAEKAANSFNPTLRFKLAWGSILIITLMAALDATSLTVALPQIASILHGTAVEAFWAGTSFMLTSTVFQPVIASLSNIFGRKALLFVSLTFFGIGAIVAAVSTSGNGMAVMLVGRSIQGVGGGGIIVLGEILATDLVPLRQRGNWLAVLGVMWAFGSVGGPLIGGGLTDAGAWRWIFWINLPFIGIGSLAVALFLRLNTIRGEFAAKLRRVDWVGMVIFIGSTTGLLIPLTWGGSMYAWDSWRTLVPLLVSAAGLAVFVVWEEKFAKEPLIPFEVIKNVTVAVTYLETFLHGLILWGILYYGPLYYEAVKGYSPLIAGVALFPQTFTVAPASIMVGVLVSVTGRYRWAIWIGWFLVTLGTGIMILLDINTSIPAWIFINIAAGLGTGMLFPSLAFGVQAATPEKTMGPAVALFVFFRSFGQAVGIAVGGVIFENQVKQKILSHPIIAAHAAEYAADSSALVEIIRNMADGPAKIALQQSYADALKIVWAVLCALGAVALIASTFTKGFDLNREHGIEQGFQHEEKQKDEEVPVVAA